MRPAFSRKLLWGGLVLTLSGSMFVGLLRSEDQPRETGESPATQSSTTLAAQDESESVLLRIREEGLKHSKAPETIDYLCNVIGPRLTASPNMRKAAAWTRDSLAGWGLKNAHLETWGPFGRGWALKQFSIQVTEPTPIILNGHPKAWSTGFEKPLEAEVVYIDARTEAEAAKYKGKLAGKIVLLGATRQFDAPMEAPATRLTDLQLARLSTRPAVDPLSRPATEPTTVPSEELLVNRAAPASNPATGPSSLQQMSISRQSSRIFAVVAQESPALILASSPKGEAGIYFVSSIALPTDLPQGSPGAFGPSTRPRPWSVDPPKAPPQVVLAIEDFNRLVRIAKRDIPIKIRCDLQTEFYGDDLMVPNVIAEIPGSDLADEVVMIGAHLDSWHAGTGATDNGVGSVAVMEAVRIIQALNLKPRRTIRIALWTGEEEGLLGSNAYVKAHFGELEDPATRPTTAPSSRPSRRTRTARRPTTTQTATEPSTNPVSRRGAKLIKGPEYEKLSAYFNLDNGSGKIRGIYCQGNTAAPPIFRQWLAPFSDLGAKTITLANTGGTDHLPFDKIGLPGFQFIQDPLDYDTRTHHSNQDVFDRVQMQDLKQASTIMAWFLWQAANEPERFPRKKLPN
jgi:hypothetical protein